MEFATFPLFPMIEGRCTCNKEECHDAGKHPQVTGWQTQRVKHTPSPGAGYGIATGTISGVFVVDVDGEEALRHLRTLGDLPPTLIVRTGRASNDGLHLYFKCPLDFQVRNDQGRKLGHMKIDIRGEGGFVVGAGSPHASGNQYRVALDAPVAEAPVWMLDMLRMSAQERREASTGAPVPVDLDTPVGEYRVKLAAEFCETCDPAVQGSGGSHALWIVSQKLVRTYELPLEAAAEIVLEMYNPRCEPEWTKQEIWHKLEDARDKGTWMTGCPSEGWVEGLVAAAHKPVRVLNATGSGGRRRREPGHAYSFTPGDRPNGEKKQISFASAIAELATHQKWAGVLQWDEFRKRAYAVDPPMRMDAEQIGGLSKKDGLRVAAWFEVNHQHLISVDMAHKAALMAAHANMYHPVKEYLDALPPHTGSSLLDTLASKVLGATEPQANEFLKKTLVAAVRRIRHPGCQMDTVLVLYGPQGVRKTTFVRELFGPEFVRSQMPDLASKDASQALGGFWAIELAELARIVNSENSTVKEFLTRVFDDYRPPYGDVEMRFARECVLIGTTNDREFLSDATGNRRYLPIEVIGKIDLDYLNKHRDEIWAEACALESADYPHWYTDETALEAARESFIREDIWHDAIEEYVRGRDFVVVNDILKYVLCGGEADLLKISRKEQMRVADTLKRLGCTSIKKDNKRTWVVPDSLRNAAPSKAELQRRAIYNQLNPLTKKEAAS